MYFTSFTMVEENFEFSLFRGIIIYPFWPSIDSLYSGKQDTQTERPYKLLMKENSLVTDYFWPLINSHYFAYFNKNWNNKTNKPYKFLKKDTSKSFLDGRGKF